LIEHRASYTPLDVDLEAFQLTLRIDLHGVAVRTTVYTIAGLDSQMDETGTM
jgi:hypothetical protein